MDSADQQRSIEVLREDIARQLDLIEDEAHRLHLALAALGGGTPSPKPSPARRTGAAQRIAKTPTAPNGNGNGHSRGSGTKDAVVEALRQHTESGGEGLTATQVAKATGLGRASVSTTLSKLAKSGEARKAARGYQLSA